MERIPLLRPQMLPTSKWMPHFRESLKTRRLSNHGPAYMEATRLINERMATNSVLVANATLGLELALRARFKKGSRIIIPTFTFKATYTAVVAAGMVPVIAPVRKYDWVLNPEYLSKSNGDGAIVVAPFGHTIDFREFENRGMPIVYDLAGAWGLDYRGENLAVYSFHATKNFCVGEGGCVVSRDKDLIDAVTKLSNFGHTNAKLSEIQCAIAIGNFHTYKPEKYEKEYREYWNQFGGGGCYSGSGHVSLLVFALPPDKVFPVLANPEFEARRYYYPLIEDMHPNAEILQKTEEDARVRTTVALPRDVRSDELRRIVRTLKNLGCGVE